MMVLHPHEYTIIKIYYQMYFSSYESPLHIITIIGITCVSHIINQLLYIQSIVINAGQYVCLFI